MDEHPSQMGATTYPPAPESVTASRHQLVRFLTGATASPEIIATAALLTSELVTNAVLHARTALTLAAEIDTDRLHVEVGDGSAEPPRLGHPDCRALGGRGLHMIEQLASRWDTNQVAGGKTVWFEIDTRSSECSSAPARRR